MERHEGTHVAGRLRRPAHAGADRPACRKCQGRYRQHNARRSDNDGEWDPTSPQAIGWHGLFSFLSNYRSGEDPIRSPGHHYTHTEKICDGRTGNCDLNKTNAEALVVPGATSAAPIRDGGKYTARAFDIPGNVITTRTGPHSFRNTTIPDQHPFSGTVDRRFTQTPDGSIHATTIGQGRAPSLLVDFANGFLGPSIFQAQNRLGGGTIFGQPGQVSPRRPPGPR